MILNPELDGIDHINIYSKGRTELGRLLSNFANTPVTITKYPEHGSFLCVEGYWYWLLAEGNEKRDELREMKGFAAKTLGRLLIGSDAKEKTKTREFRHAIAWAFKDKVQQNNRVKRLLEDSDLPFAHYYVTHTGNVMDAGYEWQLKAWERLRNLLKRGEL